MADRAQTVRNHHPRHLQALQALGNDRLGLVVERARGLVQQHEVRLEREGPSDDEALALPAREVDASLGHHRVHAHGHGIDIRFEARRMSSLPGLRLRDERPRRDVFEDRSRLKLCGLKDDPQLSPDGPHIEMGEILAVVGDHARFRGLEAEQEAQEGGLPGSRGSHQGDVLAGGGMQRDVAEDGLPYVAIGPRVTERDPIQGKRAFQGPRIRLVAAHLGRLLQDGLRALPEVADVQELDHRVAQRRGPHDEGTEGGVEGQEGSGSQAAWRPHDLQADDLGRHEEEDQRANAREDLVEDSQAVLHRQDAEMKLLVTAKRRRPVPKGPDLGRRHPQLGHPVDELHDDPRQGRFRHAQGLGLTDLQVTMPGRDRHGDQGQQAGHSRELGAIHEHQDQVQEGEEAGEEGAKRGAAQLLAHLADGHDPRIEVTHGVAPKERRGEVEHAIPDGRLNPGVGVAFYPQNQEALAELEDGASQRRGDQRRAHLNQEGSIGIRNSLIDQHARGMRGKHAQEGAEHPDEAHGDEIPLPALRREAPEIPGLEWALWKRAVKHDRQGQECGRQRLVDRNALSGNRIDADIAALRPEESDGISALPLCQQGSAILAPEAPRQGHATHLDARGAGDRLHRIPPEIHLSRGLNRNPQGRSHLTRRIQERIPAPLDAGSRFRREQLRQPHSHFSGGLAVLPLGLEEALPALLLLACVLGFQDLEELRMQQGKRHGDVRPQRRKRHTPLRVRGTMTPQNLLDLAHPACNPLGNPGIGHDLGDRKRAQVAGLERYGHQPCLGFRETAQEQLPRRDLEEEAAGRSGVGDREDRDAPFHDSPGLIRVIENQRRVAFEDLCLDGHVSPPPRRHPHARAPRRSPARSAECHACPAGRFGPSRRPRSRRSPSPSRGDAPR
ncbi:hypothetical protein D3C86_525670 [compost metagenome]